VSRKRAFADGGSVIPSAPPVVIPSAPSVVIPSAVEGSAPVLLTYLRLANLRVGLLLSFGADTMKEGLKRVENPGR